MMHAMIIGGARNLLSRNWIRQKQDSFCVLTASRNRHQHWPKVLSKIDSTDKFAVLRQEIYYLTCAVGARHLLTWYRCQTRKRNHCKEGRTHNTNEAELQALVPAILPSSCATKSSNLLPLAKPTCQVELPKTLHSGLMGSPLFFQLPCNVRILACDNQLRSNNYLSSRLSALPLLFAVNTPTWPRDLVPGGASTAIELAA